MSAIQSAGLAYGDCPDEEASSRNFANPKADMANQTLVAEVRGELNDSSVRHRGVSLCILHQGMFRATSLTGQSSKFITAVDANNAARICSASRVLKQRSILSLEVWATTI
jgi:hypothetical protein